MAKRVNKKDYEIEAKANWKLVFSIAVILPIYLSTVPTRFLPLTVSVIVRVRGKLVRLELEVTC